MRKLGIALAILFASTALAPAAFLTGTLEIGGGSNTVSITTTSPLDGTISFVPGSTVLPVANGTSGTFTTFVGDAVNFPTGTNDFNSLTAAALQPFLTVDTTGPSFTLTSETTSLVPIGGGNSSFDISGSGIFHLAGFSDTPGSFTLSTQSIGGVFQNTSFSASAMAVPGPIVGAGLPGLMAACGGLLALARRRRKVVV